MTILSGMCLLLHGLYMYTDLHTCMLLVMNYMLYSNMVYMYVSEYRLALV